MEDKREMKPTYEVESEHLGPMTHEQAGEEVTRLEKVYPVVRLMDEEAVEKESDCLLYGEGCPCMRKVCSDVLEDGGEKNVHPQNGQRHQRCHSPLRRCGR